MPTPGLRDSTGRPYDTAFREQMFAKREPQYSADKRAPMPGADGDRRAHAPQHQETA